MRATAACPPVTMTKEFKTAAIVITIVGALLFFKERKTIRFQQEQNKQYMASQAPAKKKVDDIFQANEKNLTRNDQAINKCLTLVKTISLKEVQEDDDKFFAAALPSLLAMQTDSLEKIDTAAVLHRLKKENTMIIYYEKMENPFLPLVNELKTLLGDNSYNCKLGSYSDFNTSEKETTVTRAANLEYIVVAQPEKIKNPTIEGSKSFNPGYLVTQYEVYHLPTGKKVKSSSLISSNSESLYTFRDNDARSMLRNDLLGQARSALQKTIYGTN
jgi:hypothetical protein